MLVSIQSINQEKKHFCIYFVLNLVALVNCVMHIGGSGRKEDRELLNAGQAVCYECKTTK